MTVFSAYKIKALVSPICFWVDWITVLYQMAVGFCLAGKKSFLVCCISGFIHLFVDSPLKVAQVCHKNASTSLYHLPST